MSWCFVLLTFSFFSRKLRCRISSSRCFVWSLAVLFCFLQFSLLLFPLCQQVRDRAIHLIQKILLLFLLFRK